MLNVWQSYWYLPNHIDVFAFGFVDCLEMGVLHIESVQLNNIDVTDI